MATVPTDHYSNWVVALEFVDQPSATVANGERPVRRSLGHYPGRSIIG